MFDLSIPAEDRLEIQELYARYCHFANHCDGENRADCFVENGFFSPSLGPGSGKPYEWRADLAAFISVPDLRPLQHRHWNSALTLERNGEDIKAVSYAFLLLVANVESPKIVGGVTNRDILARENGAWNLRERRSARDG